MHEIFSAADLVRVLWPEVFQTEESARSHPAREAKRLGDVPPAAAMLAVSRHAAASLDRFRALADARGAAHAKAGALLGQLLSLLRTFGTDLIVSSEKSYRGTLLGIHHGIGVIALLEDAAVAAGDQELADHCASFLSERRELCAQAEEQLAWFAQHPELATRRAHSKLITGQPLAGKPQRAA